MMVEMETSKSRKFTQQVMKKQEEMGSKAQLENRLERIRWMYYSLWFG